MLKIFILLMALQGAWAQDIQDRKATKPTTPQGLTKTKARVESIYVNGGFHTDFYDAVQKDTSGGMRKFDLAPTIGIGAPLPVYGEWRFIPEVNWVLPRTTGGSKIIKNIVMLRADAAYDPLEWLRLRAGTSIMILNQHGRGGTTQINNGESSSTFYYPDENHSSINNTFDLGAEAMYQDWSFRLQTYTYSLFKSERRQVSYSLFVSYYWNL